MDLKDYLYLYPGCDVKCSDGIIRVFISMNPHIADNALVRVDERSKVLSYPVKEVKPFLRTFSDLSVEEGSKIGAIVMGSFDSVKFRVEKHASSKGEFRYWKVHREHRGYSKYLTIDQNGEIDVYDTVGEESVHEIYMHQHEVTRYFLSRYFDLYDLIRNNLATIRNFNPVESRMPKPQQQEPIKP